MHCPGETPFKGLIFPEGFLCRAAPYMRSCDKAKYNAVLFLYRWSGHVDSTNSCQSWAIQWEIISLDTDISIDRDTSIWFGNRPHLSACALVCRGPKRARVVVNIPFVLFLALLYLAGGVRHYRLRVVVPCHSQICERETVNALCERYKRTYLKSQMQRHSAVSEGAYKQSAAETVDNCNVERGSCKCIDNAMFCRCATLQLALTASGPSPCASVLTTNAKRISICYVTHL